MKFAVAVPAREPRTEVVKIVAWVYAAVLVVMAVGQLFSFEKFIPLIGGYWLPGGDTTATLLAGLIVIVEVFALPFLLRMPLSLLMRWLSLCCGVLAAALWLFLGVVAVTSADAMTNSGVLGMKIVIPYGWPQLIWAGLMLGLAGWSAWGLWPLYKR